MKISFTTKTSFSDIESDTIILAMTEDFIETCKCPKGCVCPLCRVKKLFDFSGKQSEICPVPFGDKMVIYLGIGKENKITELTMQKVGGNLIDYLNTNKIKDSSLAINCDFDAKGKIKFTDKIGDITEAEALANIAFGIRLKNYTFNKYYTGEKLKKKTSEIKSINFICKKTEEANKKFQETEVVSENVFFARDLVSEPANVLNPESYADICRDLMSLGIEVEVLGEKAMEKLGMGSLLAVGIGSDKESQLVIMKWNGSKDKNKDPIAFVGKGITFDSGGISLKPSKGMDEMKMDMGGSAVVVSLMRLLAMRKAKVNAVGVVALVENMISGKSTRPGDIVKSMSGQTIEILNTDAEGRLILADALFYTETMFKPKVMIDLATLTGAIVSALADKNAGLFSNNEVLAKEIETSAKNTNDSVWRMPLSPLGEAYDKMIDSNIADVKNIGSEIGAGSTTAAQFLQRFINEHKKWAHLDIAGVAWRNEGNSFAKKGATGWGIRLLNDVIKNNYED